MYMVEESCDLPTPFADLGRLRSRDFFTNYDTARLYKWLRVYVCMSRFNRAYDGKKENRTARVACKHTHTHTHIDVKEKERNGNKTFHAR